MKKLFFYKLRLKGEKLSSMQNKFPAAGMKVTEAQQTQKTRNECRVLTLVLDTDQLLVSCKLTNHVHLLCARTLENALAFVCLVCMNKKVEEEIMVFFIEQLGLVVISKSHRGHRRVWTVYAEYLNIFRF